MISNSYANKILDAIVGKADAISRPAYVYLGLCKTEPNASTGALGGSEPTAPSYARKIVGGSSSDTQFGTASGGIISNSSEIQMKTAREAWSTSDDKLYYWFLSDSATGNAIIWGKLFDVDGNEGIVVGVATVPTFYERQLQASIDVPLQDDAE